MYRQHFGLRDLPFTLTPDTAFFLNRAGYQDALNVMLVALRSGEGFVKVTGEVGTGKTILCRKLVNTLGAEFVSAYIHNPYLEPRELLQVVAAELDVPAATAGERRDLLGRITARLLELHGAGRRVVLCLDEVQAMPVATLETLRLLTNLETEKRKLLQVVLFGQPELDALLEQPSVRQLRQRITFSYRLLPLNRAGLAAYVAHRLAVAGYRGEPLFSPAALELLHERSGGVPRLVNILSHKAMLAAFGKGERRITRRLVAQAVSDTLDACPDRPRSGRGGRWLRPAVALLLSMAAGAALSTALGSILAGA